VIAFNGEIYNFHDLRAELGESRSWRGHSDTETLVEAIDAWGLKETLRRCVGMFALAVWDRQDRVLSLARDRMGEKPLYYGWNGGRFLFASELKALHAAPGFHAAVDRDALGLYLCYGYVPAPWSIHEHVRKLPPGEMLVIRTTDPLTEDFARREPYWSLAEAMAGARFHGSPEDAVDELEARLSEAVRLQMVSDVPLGAFLSGGVDSSTIVALMKRHATGPVKTFSIGFEEAKYNEAPHARAVAEHLGTEHTEMTVTSKAALDVIPGLAGVWDEPFADSSQIPTSLLAKLTRKHVTVSLSGDGGDELFWGYDRYLLARRVHRLPGVKVIGGVLRLVPAELFTHTAGRLPQPLRKMLSADRAMVVRDYAEAETLTKRFEALYVRPRPNLRYLAEPAVCRYPLVDVAVPDGLDIDTAASVIDASHYLPDDIMVKVDRASMAVSLESRAPLLDHRVVEFAFSLPLSYKYRNGQTKWPLKQVLYRHVPRQIVDRPKMGFGIPLSEWLRGPLKSWADDLLDPQVLRRDGYFHADAVTTLWREHQSGLRDQGPRLWRFLMFRAWQERNACA
jgi:asparagine synthase (glutamine-hydrolysing)